MWLEDKFRKARSNPLSPFGLKEKTYVDICFLEIGKIEFFLEGGIG